MRAHVFISCGQDQESDEVAVAQAIAKGLRDLGYDPYIAVQEQTLRGLTDNLFARLADSEYLVFVDFLREQLANSPAHRGSLFSHQELAIAAFLGLDVIALQEAGTKPRDGMIRFLQTNPVEFNVRGDLPQLVLAKVKDRGWTPEWRRDVEVGARPRPVR